MPGAAKAWVNFNGTGTVAIRAQFNVSSITDNGTGDYTVNFTTALADANYAVGGVVADQAGGNSVIQIFTLSTSSARIGARNSGLGFADNAQVTVQFFR
jgi:hypothetical protein